MAAVPTFKFEVSYPGDLLEHSLLDLMVLSGPNSFFSAGTVLDAWCLDKTAEINVNQTYTGYLYSSYDAPELASAVPSMAPYMDHLDSINWLLHFIDGSNPQYTWGEVQAAIWGLMGQDYHSELPYTETDGPTNEADVDALVSMALAHDGYRPGLGDSVAMIVDPVAGEGSSALHAQPQIIEVKAAALGDRVWLDDNGNGRQDAGERGIAGAKVELVRDVDGDGLISANEVFASTQTDSAGNYRFTGLAPGLNYQVRFSTPAGFDGISPRQADGASSSGTNSDGNLSDVVVLAAGEYNQTLDAGFYKSATLGDRVWLDSNRNGVQDAGELGKAGVVLQLYTLGADGKAGTADDVYTGKQATTDANGNYLFTGLVPGSYSVHMTSTGLNPAALAVTLADIGNDATDSDLSIVGADGLSGATGAVVLRSGDNIRSVDIGLVERLGSIGDVVWNDANRDGVQDETNAGVAGVTVKLYGAGADKLIGTGDDVLLATQTTDAQGKYLFTGLEKGNYQVGFSNVAAGYGLTAANVGSDALDSDAFVSTGRTGTISLTAGQNRTDVDAGIVTTAALGNRVWLDANANGVQDAGEAGVAGVSVTLRGAGADGMLGTGDDTSATVVTDASGNYHFYNLTPGMPYQVQFGRPDGYLFTRPEVGDTATDSDADLDGKTALITLAPGEQILTLDAGLVSSASTVPDQVQVCEDRAVAFNVLTNDLVALKLVGVAHESAELDSLFQSRGGALSFTEDGAVVYKTMDNYYGHDKLVYTVEDMAGNRFQQTVDVGVNAVSDAPISTGDYSAHPQTWDNTYSVGVVRHWVHQYTLSDFGLFSDAADELQQFGAYNNGVANDVDGLKAVVIAGPEGQYAEYAKVVYNGQALDFSQGQTYAISVADIQAGKLAFDFTKLYVSYTVGWQLEDSGSVANGVCYDGSVLSNEGHTFMRTPVALDLSGDGKIGVTGATASYQKDAGAALGHTVQFDFNGDGVKERSEWFDGSGDGILIDNRDGHAAGDMNGLRLFGDAQGHGNGYYQLATLDTNHDGVLSGGELKGIELWVDNGDAVVQSGEIQSLAAHGIDAIQTQVALTYDAEGLLHLVSTASRTDGSALMSEDVFFAGLKSGTPTLAELLGDDTAFALEHDQAVAGSADGHGVEVSMAAEVLRQMAAAQTATAVV